MSGENALISLLCMW